MSAAVSLLHTNGSTFYNRCFVCETLSTSASAVAFIFFILLALALAFVVYLLHINVYDHITLNTPVLVRSQGRAVLVLGDRLGIIFLPLIQCLTKEHTVPKKGAYGAKQRTVWCRTREHTVPYVP